MEPKISEITRRDLWEVLAGVEWWGRLDEVSFLKRLYSLDFLASTDSRFKDAEGDIIQHRVNNEDWGQDWVFSDERFELTNGSDETLLKFLSEMLHPAVRKPEDAERLVKIVNPLLRADGYQVVPKSSISGRPVYGWETVDTDHAADAHFTKNIKPLMATLSELAAHSGSSLEQEVLSVAKPKLEEPEYDNWDGGTYYYTLKLIVPVATFTRLGAGLNELEQDLVERIGQVHRGTDHHRITAVVIQPGQVTVNSVRTTSVSVGSGPLTFWTPGHFRLFLSHVSASKTRAAALRQFLTKFHISAFVAHETIDAGELWQREIEKALWSMDALAAILTSDFHESNWTDQEIGWALGRGIYVLPIRRGKDPYGFVGEVQGIQGEGKSVPAVADEVFLALTRNAKTRERMHEVLVEAFEQSAAGHEAVTNFKLIERAGILSAPLLRRLEAAADSNRHIGAISVRVKRMAATP